MSDYDDDDLIESMGHMTINPHDLHDKKRNINYLLKLLNTKYQTLDPHKTLHVHLEGKFRCSCKNTWTSKAVTMVIQLNKPRIVVVCGQKCKYCDDDYIHPRFKTEEWNNQVLHTLDKYLHGSNSSVKSQAKKWKKLSGGHQSDRCQACQLGYCKQTKNNNQTKKTKKRN